MTIRTKLILSFALMLVLTAILGGAALWETKRLSASQDLVVNDRLPKLIAVERIIIFETRIQQNIREYLIQTDAAERQKLLDRIAEYRKENADLRNYLKESITSEQGKKLLGDLIKANVDLVETNNMIVEWVQNGYLESAAKSVVAPETREKRLAQRKALQALVDYQKELARESGKEGLNIANQTQWLVAVILILSLALGVGLVLYILKAVVRPINDMKQVMQDIVEDGNFKRQLDVSSQDEIGLALISFNQLLKTLEESLEETGQVVLALSEGDFSKRINGEYVGTLNDVKQGVNTSVELVSETMQGLSKLMQSMSQGDFKAQFNANVKGDFRRMADNAMDTITALDQIISEVNAIMAQVVKGQFEGRVGVDAQGDLAILKSSINNTLTNLEDVIGNIKDVLSAQAEGDFNKTVTVACEGQLKELSESIEFTAGKVIQVVSQISQSTEVVSSAASELAQGSSDLSSRVQQQAAALEETSATMDEMASTVNQNTENALQAADISQQASKEAAQGMSVMTQTIEAMNGIKESSHKIADIVNLIDGIAFQTNLLALNAAVEAARAGDHGRGFAVVAGEVRALAQKSAEAAKDIKTLIEESVTRVENGSRLAEDSGQSLETITGVIHQVNEMLGHIAQASEEQSTGVEQVNKAVTDIDQMTQQNAALVEESASAAEELTEQADEMRSAVSFFKIKGMSHQHVAASLAKAHAQVQKPAEAPVAALPEKAKPAQSQAPKATSSGAPSKADKTEDDGEWATF